ncbi:MAG: hypothetical protein HGA93_01290 [Methanothrix sp.]|nr:hypothetical protein [Methanothrix sp.]
MKQNLNSINERVIAARRAERQRFLVDRWYPNTFEYEEETDNDPVCPICSNAP